MNLTKLTTLLLSVVLLQACNSSKKVSTEANKTIWVAGSKAECSAGAGLQQCLLISKSENVQDAAWEYFYSPIENFEFKEGVAQKIEIEETEKSPENLPQDVSSILYKQLEVVDAKADTFSLLKGDWMLVAVNQGPVNRMVVAPSLSLNPYSKTINGSDGCNTFNGMLTSINYKNISIGTLAKTNKACIKKDMSAEFYAALENVNSYVVSKESLTLTDVNHNEVLKFIKK